MSYITIEPCCFLTFTRLPSSYFIIPFPICWGIRSKSILSDMIRKNSQQLSLLYTRSKTWMQCKMWNLDGERMLWGVKKSQIGVAISPRAIQQLAPFMLFIPHCNMNPTQIGTSLFTIQTIGFLLSSWNSFSRRYWSFYCFT